MARKRPCGHEEIDRTCPQCLLYESDPIFRAAWGGPPSLFQVVPGLYDPLPDGSPSREQHIEALGILRTTSIPPPRAEGDGIVICGGGRWWPMTVMSVCECRRYSQLPIQVWHGPAQPVYPNDLGDVPGVSYHNGAAYPHRSLADWNIKTVALTNCGLRRALYLDADAYPLEDPVPLLDLAAKHGFVYWEGGNYKDNDWGAWGLSPAWHNKIPPVQGGQFALDLSAWWRPLAVAHWMCQHFDHARQFCPTDEGCYRAAIAATGGSFFCLGGVVAQPTGAIAYLEGRPVIVHRTTAKVWLERSPHLPHEASALSHLKRLSGDPSPPAPTVAAPAAVVAARNAPCICLGEVVDKVGCNCPARWLRKCALGHGDEGLVSIGTHCKTCDDYDPV
jgi:hypothetical protein